MDAKRDWGHAKDYVEMQWLMLQQEKPEDFVIATGVQYSVRDFVNAAAKELGMQIRWEGKASKKKATWTNPPNPANPKIAEIPPNTPIVAVDPRYFRPTEVETLLGDPTKAKSQTRLDAEDHLRRTGRRNGARRPESRRTRRTGQEARLQGHGLPRDNVKRLLFLGSSCIYPKLAPQPMKEEHLLTGPLEPTNRPYALAKIAGIEMCWSYNRQYGTQYLASCRPTSTAPATTTTRELPRHPRADPPLPRGQAQQCTERRPSGAPARRNANSSTARTWPTPAST
jgi:GDP-D-mannose dehydratase